MDKDNDKKTMEENTEKKDSDEVKTGQHAYPNKYMLHPGDIYHKFYIERPYFSTSTERLFAEAIYFIYEHFTFSNVHDLFKMTEALDEILISNKKYTLEVHKKERLTDNKNFIIHVDNIKEEKSSTELLKWQDMISEKELKTIDKKTKKALDSLFYEYPFDYQVLHQLKNNKKTSINWNRIMQLIDKLHDNISDEFDIQNYIPVMEQSLQEYKIKKSKKKEQTLQELQNYLKILYRSNQNIALIKNSPLQDIRFKYLPKKNPLTELLKKKNNSILKNNKRGLSQNIYSRNMRYFIGQLLEQKDYIESHDDFIELSRIYEHFNQLIALQVETVNDGNILYSSTSIIFMEKHEYDLLIEKDKEQFIIRKRKTPFIVKHFVKISIALICLLSFYVFNKATGFFINPVPETYSDKYDFILNNPYSVRGILKVKKGIYLQLFPLLLGFLGSLFAFYTAITLTSAERKSVVKGTEYGTAEWIENLDKVRLQDNDKDSNMIFSKRIKVSTDWRKNGGRNTNVLLQGASGTGKTRYFVKPNLIEGDYNFIVTDPKGTLFGETGEYFKNKGYNIKVLRLIQSNEDKIKNRYNSDGYNFFEYIESHEDVVATANELNDISSDEDTHKGDSFWVDSARDLLSCIIGYLKFVEKDPFKKNASEALRLMRSIKTDGTTGEFQEKMNYLLNKEKRTVDEEYACGLWTQFMQASEKTIQSILISTTQKLSLFDTPAVAKLTQHDELRLKDFAKEEKCILYVITSDSDGSMDFLASILYKQCFKLLFNLAKEHDSDALPIHLQFILDEFANIGQIPDFEKKIGTIRSRNMGMTIIIQDFGQLERLYETYGRKTIEGNCDYFISLGVGSSHDSAKYISERLGERTIEMQTTSKTYGTTTSSTQSNQVIKRPLMTPTEVSNYEGIIMIITKLGAIKDERYELQDHPNYHLIADSGTNTPYYTRVPLEQRKREMYRIRAKLLEEGADPLGLPLATAENDELTAIEKEAIETIQADGVLDFVHQKGQEDKIKTAIALKEKEEQSKEEQELEHLKDLEIPEEEPKEDLLNDFLKLEQKEEGKDVFDLFQDLDKGDSYER